MVKQAVIIAPHPDDEIIGCYEILKSESSIIIYDGETETKRREQALKLKEFNDKISAQLFQMNVPSNFLNQETTFYFPDPIYELHPLHRRWGSLGEQLARGKFDVVFYTTNMNAPYIHEVDDSNMKEEILNQVYPDQKSLWEYDKKYVLFEGRCKWIF